MKAFAVVIAVFFILAFQSIDKMVESGVYSFLKSKVEKTNTGEKRQLIDGETIQLKNLEIHATTLNPGKAPHGSQIHADAEEIVLVKDGKLEITINGNTRVMGPGSLALIMPGDEHGIVNACDSQSTYYIIKYVSKMTLNAERGKLTGGSQMFDFDSIPNKPHNKGGVRKYFDRSSSMSERIEMHVTTLNPGIKSHEPHNHNPAEILVMMDGTTEMEIGEKLYPGEPGDVYFLESNSLHGIRNTGNKPCMYLAFQWE